MRCLTASEQLRVWERGRLQTPAWRSLLLLANALPECPVGELARFPIGRRDSCLLKLRELTFGPGLESVVACPNCSERLELNFEISDVCAETGNLEPGVSHLLTLAGYRVRFRLPDSTDLEAIVQCQKPEDARGQLIERCVIEVKRGGKNDNSKLPLSRLPSKVVNALVKRMADIDPQANIQLSFTCPACRHSWTSAFDIVSFLWSEIDEWARRILHEVHLIASAYGWNEADILEMSALRRSNYIGMICN